MSKFAGFRDSEEIDVHRASISRSAGQEAAALNELLSDLTHEERHRLLPNAQQVSMSLGQVVYEAGACLDYAYFPTKCAISCLYTTQEGATVQMALIGEEGIAGLGFLLGCDDTPDRAVVQIAGTAIRIPAKLLRHEFERAANFQHVILRYTLGLLAQVSQTAVCNRLHSVEQRLCRWLLECDDRVHGCEIRMTQENIANMLGVRREGVTVAAGRLQDSGLIKYSRGHIHILDRRGLELVVCECYHAVEYQIGLTSAKVGQSHLRR